MTANRQSANTRLLVCNCEKSMPVDGKLIGNAITGEETDVFTQLCRSQIGSFEKAISDDKRVCVGCTQEAPLFSEIAEAAGVGEPTYFNIRELAGWSDQGSKAGPKMAALAALATRPFVPIRMKTIESDGLCLVVGRGQQAFETAELLNRTLSVTLLLEDAGDVVLPTKLDFPIYSGIVKLASGSFGNFEVVVDRYAAMLPSSRARPEFAMGRDGAKSACSIIFDITGNTPLFPHHEKRDGYYRPDPGNPAGILEAAFEAAEMVGSFEKPIHVGYDAEICAHARSGKTGCTKCLDNCPAGAIQPDGDGVSIDTAICGGCGNCAAHCPTGAVHLEAEPLAERIGAVQSLASTFIECGGKSPALLIHDGGFGMEILNALARFGDGLPANVIPFAVHSTSGIGHALLAAAISSGFERVYILANPQKLAEYEAAEREIELFDALCEGFGIGGGRISIVSERDPDILGEQLREQQELSKLGRRPFEPIGTIREMTRAGITSLARAADSKAEIIDLPQWSPYGAIRIDTDGCTLCLACVTACPADALRDNPEKPQVRFVESACVQCGICSATCPEKVISLQPRYNLTPAAMQPVTLYEEEPFECTRCGKPFAAKSTIERISRQLAGVHRMFASGKNAALLEMCDTCRLEVLAEQEGDPFAIANPRKMRTTDDYLEIEKKGLSIDDFLNDD